MLKRTPTNQANGSNPDKKQNDSVNPCKYYQNGSLTTEDRSQLELQAHVCHL